MDLNTWVSLGVLLGFAITLFGYLGTIKRDLTAAIVTVDAKVDASRIELKGDISDLRGELKGDISELRVELKGDISDLRGELKGELGKLDARLMSLENRTYDISTRLPAAPAASS